MLKTAIYLLTALATGTQVFRLLAWGIWGAPPSPLQCISFLGSIALLVAGVFAKSRTKVAAFAAVGAVIAMWCFYAPAIIHTIYLLPPTMTIQSGLVAFTPVVLLILSTGYAIASIVSKRPAT